MERTGLERNGMDWMGKDWTGKEWTGMVFDILLSLKEGVLRRIEIKRGIKTPSPLANW